MFIHRVCSDLSRVTNRTYYSPNGGDVQVSLKEMATNTGFWSDNRSGCFGPLRMFIKIPDLENDRIVVHLRDPRDVLVSMYYSYCYSHSGEIAGGTGYRKEIAENGIDDFVLKMATAQRRPVEGDYGTGAHLWEIAGNVSQRYLDYVQQLIEGHHENVVLVRYEEMVADLDTWFIKVAEQFEVDDSAMINGLVNQYRPMFNRAGENQWVHLRKVTPGDYLEKLRPSTIAELDCIFASTLEALGY